MPQTFPVAIQELCPNEQNMHHAELRAVARAQECFRRAIIHADSSSAIDTFRDAATVQGTQLHKPPQPALAIVLKLWLIRTLYGG